VVIVEVYVHLVRVVVLEDVQEGQLVLQGEELALEIALVRDVWEAVEQVAQLDVQYQQDKIINKRGLLCNLKKF
jgi:hypothetical protein